VKHDKTEEKGKHDKIEEKGKHDKIEEKGKHDKTEAEKGKHVSKTEAGKGPHEHQVRPTETGIGEPVCTTESGKGQPAIRHPICTPEQSHQTQMGKGVCQPNMGTAFPVCTPEDLSAHKGQPITLPELKHHHHTPEVGKEYPTACKVEMGKGQKASHHKVEKEPNVHVHLQVPQTPPKMVMLSSIRNDHVTIRANIETLLTMTDLTHKLELFNDTVKMFSQYDVGEEVVLYSTIRNLGMIKSADTALEQTKQIEQLLYDMDQKYGNGISDMVCFNGDLIKLRDTFNVHANLEENEIFPQLEIKLSHDDIDSINNLFDRIKGLAPTRPHPSGPHSTAGKLLTGPVLSFVDRFRDLAKQFTKTP